MKTFAFEVVGHVMVVVSTSDPPNSADWDVYVREARVLADRVGGRQVRNLIISGGGGPSQTQRKQLYEAFPEGRNAPTAVVTNNAFVRTIAGAMSVFNRNMKVFKPDAMGEAFRYLGISELDGKVIWRSVTKLQRELGIVSGPR